MFNKILIIGLLISSIAIAVPRTKSTDCSPSVEKEKQHRSEMKHRAIPTGDIKPTLVSVNDMLNWDVPKNPRGEMSDPRELQVFTVEGYVIHAKLAPDDCDVHMEIAATNDDKAPRVIVEIPNDKGFEEAQSQRSSRNNLRRTMRSGTLHPRPR